MSCAHRAAGGAAPPRPSAAVSSSGPPPRQLPGAEFLQQVSDDSGWGAGGAFHCLTPQVLAQINEWFKGYSRNEKLQCLLSFFHAKPAHLAKSKHTMQSIIEQAVLESDDWVRALGRLLSGCPATGAIRCCQVDSEFVYRLTEVVRLPGQQHRGLPQPASAEIVGTVGRPPACASPDPAAVARPPFDRTKKRAASLLDAIEREAREVAAIVGVGDDSEEDDEAPRRPAPAPGGAGAAGPAVFQKMSAPWEGGAKAGAPKRPARPGEPPEPPPQEAPQRQPQEAPQRQPQQAPQRQPQEEAPWALQPPRHQEAEEAPWAPRPTAAESAPPRRAEAQAPARPAMFESDGSSEEAPEGRRERLRQQSSLLLGAAAAAVSREPLIRPRTPEAQPWEEPCAVEAPENPGGAALPAPAGLPVPLGPAAARGPRTPEARKRARRCDL